MEPVTRRRGRRGKALGANMRVAVILLAMVAAAAMNSCSSIFTPAITSEVNMGITGASQPLWRYVAQQRDKLLTPSGYLVSFTSYNSEAELRKAFLNGDIDVMATLPPQVPALAQEGVNAQYFLPIAWLKEGYPIVVPVESGIHSLSDLDGKKLSTFQSDHPGFAYWQAFIQANYGFRLVDRTSLVMSLNPGEPLLNGDADAATLDSVAWGQLKGTGKFRVVSDLATEWAKLSGSSRPLAYGGYVARKEWLDENQQFVEDFIRANYRALQDYKKDQKTFMDIAGAYSEGGAQSIPADVLQSVADYLGMSQVGADRAYLTDADVADYDKIFQLLAKTGYLRGSVPPTASFFYISGARPKS
ncbi:MAG: PhnD/SsuA/transferrin family substrate-binding protein [Dehalococcoidia bacterium]|nr:PhnD/SsuA/transferrin family substrate-binding protein [Dehalococcoidia bacterium]